MEIKNYILSTLLLLGLAACSSDPYDGNSSGLGNDDPYLYVPNVIKIAVGDPAYKSLTRGMGAFDANREDSYMAKQWDDARIFVYSFPKDFPDFTKLSTADSASCLIDATSKSPETSSKTGKSAHLNYMSGNFIDWSDGTELYYNSVQPKRRYNFFGYYYDDAIVDESNFTRTKDQISFPIEIDGSQDVMGGYAQIDSTTNIAIKNNRDRDSIYAYYYSNYTARSDHNVFPIINFNHYLTRLKFDIYPMDSTSKHVYVDSISVNSTYKGEMVVAASDVSDLGLFISRANRKEMFLHDVNRALIKPDSFFVALSPDDEALPYYSRSHKQVGESLMLPSETSYRITLYMHQTEPKEIFYTNNYEITNNGYIFKPGYEYTIRILVAGMKPVQPEVELTGWANGGSIILNQEDQF